METTFKPASKSQSKLRAAIYGPSGSGKTFTALSIAKGIGGKIAVIDTEYGSASKYADRFTFDTINLKVPTVENYQELIVAAGKLGYSVCVIDSMSHGWQELLDEMEKLTKSQKYAGNSFRAWGEITPKQRDFVQTILACPCHLIATMRSKTEWAMQTNDRGKQQPVRIGLAPEQGKGIEYEFDLLMVLSSDHFGTIEKDRTGHYQDRVIEKPGEMFGQELAAWLSDGKAVPPPAQTAPVAPQATQAASKATPAPEAPKANIPRPQTDEEIMGVARVIEFIQSKNPGRPVSFDKFCSVWFDRVKKWPKAPGGVVDTKVLNWAVVNININKITEQAA